MKYEDLMKLDDRTLLVIKGVDYFGNKVYRTITLHKEWLTSKGYMAGGVLYPYEWFRLPTDKDYQSEVKRLTDNYNKSLERLKEAFKKAGK